MAEAAARELVDGAALYRFCVRVMTLSSTEEKAVSYGPDGDHVSLAGRVGLEPTTEGL
jgi:hypothetical protein